MSGHHLSAEQLYAYDDGMLSAAEQRSVEQHLTTCPGCQARLERSAAVARALKHQLGKTRAPESLRRSILLRAKGIESQASVRSSPSRRGLALVSAGVAALVLLFTIAIMRWNAMPPLLPQLAEAHRLVVGEPGGIQMPSDAVALNQWLDEQMHEHIDVSTPDGLTLVGARLDRIDNRVAAHVQYREANGDVMSLFIWHEVLPLGHLPARHVDGSDFFVGTQNGENVALWQENGITYACVGEMPPEQLLDLAASFRRRDAN